MTSPNIYLQYREALANELKLQNSPIKLVVLTAQKEMPVARYYSMQRHGEFEHGKKEPIFLEQREKHENAFKKLMPLFWYNIGEDNVQSVNQLMFDATGFEYIEPRDTRYRELEFVIKAVSPIGYAEWFKNSERWMIERTLLALQEKQKLEQQGVNFDELAKKAILNLSS